MAARLRRVKDRPKVSLYPPQTTSNESFANVFQSGQREQPPRRPTISQIQRRVENIRRSSKKIKSGREPLIPDPTMPTHITITYGSIQEQLEVILPKCIALVNEADQNDKLGPVFSPYKEKSPERQPRTLSTTIEWSKQSDRYNRTSVAVSSMDNRRRSLRSAMQPRVQERVTPLLGSRRGMSAKSSSGMKLKKSPTLLQVAPPSVATSSPEPYYVNISKLGDLYEVLTEIALAVKNDDPESFVLKTKMYVEFLNSGELEFLDGFLELSEPKTRKELQFARCMEYLAVIYLMLEYIKGELKEHEVNVLNLLGHCASNVIFLMRLVTLTCRPVQHLPQTPLQTSIDRFQINEFKELLQTVEQVGLRMQHNNETISLLEGKIGRSHGRLSRTVKQLLRNIDRQKYSASECCHYLFEFLSYHLYENELNNRVPFLDLAPSPYLNPPSSDKYTVVLEPYGILFTLANSRTLFRPLAKKTVEYLSRYFEVILWTWMMPSDIDPWLDQIDPDRNASTRLYKYHCFYQNEIYTKNILRLGRPLERTIIVDYDHRIYSETPDNGIELGWNTRQKDQKLLDLTQILQEMRRNELEVYETLRVYNEEICRLRYKRAQRQPTK